MLRGAILILLVSVVLSAAESALGQEEDYCKDVLRFTGRDLTEERYQSDVAKAIFDQHCQGDSYNRSSSAGIGLEAVVKAIPIKFSFNSGDNETKMVQFCKTFHSELTQHSDLYANRSLVVADAVHAWESCMALGQRGVVFRPQIAETVVTIGVKRKEDPVTVTSVTVTPDATKLECSADNEAGSATVAVGPTTRKTLKDSVFWNITCKRIGVQHDDGHKEYPRSEITIATSRGTLLLPVAKSIEMPHQWATEFEASLKSLNEALTKFKADQAGTIKSCSLCWTRGGTGGTAPCGSNHASGGVVENEGCVPMGQYTPAVHLVHDSCTLSWKVVCR